MFFLSKETQKETFFDILNKREPFLDLKSEVSKQSKKSRFFKSVNPRFFQKIELFFIFFFK